MGHAASGGLEPSHPKSNYKEYTVDQQPGRVYTGSPCRARYYVELFAQNESALYPSVVLDAPLEAVLLLRSKVFRACRSSTESQGPAPAALWAVLTGAVQEGLAENIWHVPTLADLEQKLQDITST